MNHTRTLARLTGVAYFGLMPGAIVGYLVLRPQLVDPASAANTLQQVVANPGLARLAVGGMMLTIVAQALTSLGFYALFRERHPVSAFAIASFGLVNAAAILAGAAASWSALQLAPTVGPEGAAVVQALYLVDNNAWNLGGLFFGLWLIPMGWAAWKSSWFHAGHVLGWILMIGGVFYVLGAGLGLVPAATESGLADLCAMPATVGELWMMFALIIVGIREHA